MIYAISPLQQYYSHVIHNCRYLFWIKKAILTVISLDISQGLLLSSTFHHHVLLQGNQRLSCLPQKETCFGWSLWTRVTQTLQVRGDQLHSPAPLHLGQFLHGQGWNPNKTLTHFVTVARVPGKKENSVLPNRVSSLFHFIICVNGSWNH